MKETLTSLEVFETTAGSAWGLIDHSERIFPSMGNSPDLSFLFTSSKKHPWVSLLTLSTKNISVICSLQVMNVTARLLSHFFPFPLSKLTSSDHSESHALSFGFSGDFFGGDEGAAFRDFEGDPAVFLACSTHQP